ncbi:hypothetical protein K438DRAFT_1835684, partial [Mycena galopus ATCC 62051]
MCTLPSNPTPAGEQPATPCAITDTPPCPRDESRHEINFGPPPSYHPRRGWRTQDPSNVTQKKIQENPQTQKPTYYHSRR